MKRIEITAPFNHDGQAYHKGEVRILEEPLAGFFCGVGWARDTTGEIATGEIPAPSEATLNIQSGTIGQSAVTPGEK